MQELDSYDILTIAYDVGPIQGLEFRADLARSLQHTGRGTLPVVFDIPYNVQ